MDQTWEHRSRAGGAHLRFHVMMKYPNWFYGYLILSGLLVLSLFCQPCLFVCGGGNLVASAPAIPGTPLEIHFMHSVQRTPVQESLAVEPGGFRLLSTRYRSFGVGLPFLESEGEFREEDGSFVMDHMDRFYPQLALRTGVGTQLRLCLHGREYRLYEMFPPGTKIDLFIAPLYHRWIYARER